jgi:adenylate cyclase
MNLPSFFAELKRRNVYKVAIAYAVIAWLLMQIATQVFPFLEIPNWAIRLVIMLLALGFPIALIIAWAFELTPEGLKRTEVADAEPAKPSRNKAWIYLVIIAAAISVGVFCLGRYTSSKPSSAELPVKSIAVLPFDNQNRDSNTDYLSDGIPESIINSLSQLPQLRVMARSTVFSYKGKDVDPRRVGHDLGVGAVLMSRLIQQGDNLTIRTELVDVSDGTEIWGQQYNRKLADVFAVQEEIAKEISEKLRLKLTGAERQQLAKRPTENLKAFQYYMQGQAYAQRSTREDLLTAIHYYDKAIDEDGDYALAYSGLADAYAVLGARGYIAPIEGRRKSEDAARKALTLDDNLAEAHVALGLIYLQFAPSNFSLADGELRRAIELSPSLAMARQYSGVSLVRQGRLDESFEKFLKARELDPLSSTIARAQGLPYYLKRDYTRALELLRQANELGPPFTTTGKLECTSKTDYSMKRWRNWRRPNESGRVIRF